MQRLRFMTPFNHLKPSVIMWLHFERAAPYRPNLRSTEYMNSSAGRLIMELTACVGSSPGEVDLAAGDTQVRQAGEKVADDSRRVGIVAEWI